MKKVLHIAAVNTLLDGQRQQLMSEYAAVRQIGDVEWDIVAFHNGVKAESFEREYPFLFRGLFLRDLFSWLYMLSVYKKYDFILQRHVPFDPFSFLFAWMVPNRISIHHTKEIEELRSIRSGWRGSAASFLEKLSGRSSINSVVAVAGVTNEISLYQRARTKRQIKNLVYPNGINVDNVPRLCDDRNEDINIAFVCSYFSKWQGLERLLTTIIDNPFDSDFRVYLHLIGVLSDEQKKFIESIHVESFTIYCHGYTSGTEYRNILAKCDIGLGSLALDVKNLKEACTLKVREYLAMGLPVYATHIDTSLPDDFPYYRNGLLNISEIINFSSEMRMVNRDDVRHSARVYIDKKAILVRFIQDLEML